MKESRRGGRGGPHLEDRQTAVPVSLPLPRNWLPCVFSPGQSPWRTGDDHVCLGTLGWSKASVNHPHHPSCAHHTLIHASSPLGAENRPVWVQPAVVHQHEEGSEGKAAGHQANHHQGGGVRGLWAAVGVPGGCKSHILSQRHRVVERHAEPAGALLDVEPAEDVDDAHDHVVDDLLPLRHAEVCLTLDNPEGHDTPRKTQRTVIGRITSVKNYTTSVSMFEKSISSGNVFC